MKPLTMKQAAEIAEKLWSQPGSETIETETIGIIKRKKTNPRFMVGMAYLDGTAAVTLGSSNVDWESAFMNAAFAGHCTMLKEFDPNQEDV